MKHSDTPRRWKVDLGEANTKHSGTAAALPTELAQANLKYGDIPQKWKVDLGEANTKHSDTQWKSKLDLEGSKLETR